MGEGSEGEKREGRGGGHGRTIYTIKCSRKI